MYAQVIQDLHEECGKYGSVVAVVIPRPHDPATSAAAFGTGNIGKVCTLEMRKLAHNICQRWVK